MRLEIGQTDNNDKPYINCDEEAEPLKHFIETELMQDLAYTNLLLGRINNAKNKPVEMSGNQYCLVVSNDKFLIENLFDDDDKCAGNLSFLTEILNAWARILSNN